MPKSRQGLLSEIVWPKEAYSRSTNIELDSRDSSGLADYRFTAKSLGLLEEVLDGANGSRRDRAWSIIGPYGSGKSTFSLFLIQLLSGATTPWLERCLLQLGITAPDLPVYEGEGWGGFEEERGMFDEDGRAEDQRRRYGNNPSVTGIEFIALYCDDQT